MVGVASLGRLIEEICASPERITRAHFLGTQSIEDPYWALVAEQPWSGSYAGAVDDHLDGAIAQVDLAVLGEVGAKVRHHVDKHVAHAEASAPTVTLTL